MADRPLSDERGVRGDFSCSSWTREQAESISREETNVAPIINPSQTRLDKDLQLWDTWLLRNRFGEVTTIDGWRVAFSLTAPADLSPRDRHDVASIRYFYSRDGKQWECGGELFEGDAYGQRQWSGSAVYDDGDLYVFYTATGHRGDTEITDTQRIAGATTDRVGTATEAVTIEGPWSHEILLEPDGDWYETEGQSEGMTYTFRDPWFYEDPRTGETYLLFEANTPLSETDDTCGDGTDRRQYNGCVGVAVSPSRDPFDWELRAPLLVGTGVNHELERPHVVRHDDRYYLFVSTHRHMFAPGVEGYEGLYGWVADSFRGPYRPINDSGLVVTNPSDAPFQSYSWMVYAHGEELLVHSFFNYYDFAGDSLDEITQLSESEQSRRFGGTLGPTLRLEVDGGRSELLGTLDSWHLPTGDDTLPEPVENR
ncbi:glycoside hydrolase family 68 protein [Halomicrobium salinisoli]|uniref:glycoside hydrolase family 68 protein n=1 Tax=Halomicrobium salinisoli TaxID=2878391 RepID=UPI001CF052B0|nr:glycoside hydrolase family 68 protein [Halomicrobium salinisoli]